MKFFAVQKSDGVGVAALAERVDEPCGTFAPSGILMFGRSIKRVGEPRDDKLLEHGLALGRHDLGSMQDFLGEVDRGFHGQHLQLYRDVVKRGF